MLVAEKNSLDLLYQTMENILYIYRWWNMVPRGACSIIGLKHYLHSSTEKSLMERVNQYFKDRIESFDDYYPCIGNECNLFHVHNWIQFFISMYNDTIAHNNFDF